MYGSNSESGNKEFKDTKNILRLLESSFWSSGSVKPLSIEYVHDVYRSISAKNCSRDKRGQSETRVHFQSLEQKMLSNKEWLAFFHNIKNKQHLLNLFITHLCADDFAKSRLLPTPVKNENEIFKISNSVTKAF